ncbi:hypothetical protein BN11_180012 [Nostocoides australiense Ben110]|uniref:Uncharacterized protein n=1 Tax=Nostocoides australiense Ben110 TaxID=1193182 RepID=W6K2K5_9MICO|nr:hypothetical protein BN11_180012 [Tetrasphaera australiensis Ben110]
MAMGQDVPRRVRNHFGTLTGWKRHCEHSRTRAGAPCSRRSPSARGRSPNWPTSSPSPGRGSPGTCACCARPGSSPSRPMRSGGSTACNPTPSPRWRTGSPPIGRGGSSGSTHCIPKSPAAHATEGARHDPSQERPRPGDPAPRWRQRVGARPGHLRHRYGRSLVGPDRTRLAGPLDRHRRRRAAPRWRVPRRLLHLRVGGGRPGARVRPSPSLSHRDLVIVESGIPVAQLAAYGAGVQMHAEGLAAHVAGREPVPAQQRWRELIPRYEALSVSQD